MTQTEKEIYWREAIESCQTSGSAISTFCRKRQINAWQFYYWRRRFQKTEIEPVAANFIQLSVESSKSCGVSLTCGNITIDLERDFDEDVLSRVLRILPC